MKPVTGDLSVGPLGLRVVRFLTVREQATAAGLACDLRTPDTSLQVELERLASLGIVVANERSWSVSIDGLRQWREQLEGRLLGAR
jgi:hypothetical protein